MLLVTHDRFLLDRVSTEILALDGKGGSRFFAGYSQWEARKDDVFEPLPPAKAAPKPVSATAGSPERLTRSQRRELEKIEQLVVESDANVERLKQQMLLPDIAANHLRLQEVWQELQDAEAEAARLYGRWADLDQLQAV